MPTHEIGEWGITALCVVDQLKANTDVELLLANMWRATIPPTHEVWEEPRTRWARVDGKPWHRCDYMAQPHWHAFTVGRLVSNV